MATRAASESAGELPAVAAALATRCSTRPMQRVRESLACTWRRQGVWEGTMWRATCSSYGCYGCFGSRMPCGTRLRLLLAPRTRPAELSLGER